MSARTFTPLAPEAGSLDPQVVEQAAEWMIRLQHGDDSSAQRDCDAWRAAAVEHELAWQRLAALSRDLRIASPPLAAAALDQAHETFRRQRRTSLKWLLGIGLTAGVAWQWDRLLDNALPIPLLADLSTGTGERRTVTLADGTQISLNSGSVVGIDFDAKTRRIVLHRGEIMITTAPDAAGRPFLVGAGHGDIAPVGTRFTVRRLEDDGHPIRVAVLEGAVDIRPLRSAESYRLPAGRQADYTVDGILREHASHATDAAWTQGLLVASRMPLGQFVAELARHRSGLLRCDPSAADLLVTGAFPLENSDDILAMLEQILPVRAEYRTRYWVTLTRR